MEHLSTDIESDTWRDKYQKAPCLQVNICPYGLKVTITFVFSSSCQTQSLEISPIILFYVSSEVEYTITVLLILLLIPCEYKQRSIVIWFTCLPSDIYVHVCWFVTCHVCIGRGHWFRISLMFTMLVVFELLDFFSE